MSTPRAAARAKVAPSNGATLMALFVYDQLQ
jgi:hypothetical protein